MSNHRIYHTIRTRTDTAERLIERGDTGRAADLNQLTIAQTLVEILDTLHQISETLTTLVIQTPVPAQQGPTAARPAVPAPKPVPAQPGKESK